MKDDELLRYSRQIMLPELDIAGQEKLLEARVAILGVGGLGSPAALYLAAAGIGHLTLVDGDVVEVTNLQRQVTHSEAQLGEPKVISARAALERINPEISTSLIAERVGDPQTMQALCESVDVVVDGTDNFSTRYLLNDAALATNTPTVSAAAIRFDGQITVFDPRDERSPCYRCLYREGSDDALNCSENGVIAPLVGIIGTMQAMETIKLIAGCGEPLIGRLLVFDARRAEWQSFRLPRDPGCPACGQPQD